MSKKYRNGKEGNIKGIQHRQENDPSKIELQARENILTASQKCRTETQLVDGVQLYRPAVSTKAVFT